MTPFNCIICGRELTDSECLRCLHVGEQDNETLLDRLERHAHIDARLMEAVRQGHFEPKEVIEELLTNLGRLAAVRHELHRRLKGSQ